MGFNILIFVFTSFFYLTTSQAFLGLFEKKVQQKAVVEEKLSEDDKIDFVDRTEKDLTKLKSINVFVSDSLDANSVFKIKSVLQDNTKIYKVIPSESKNFLIYFNDEVDKETVLELITAAGFQAEIK